MLDEAKRLLSYDQETGLFRWKTKAGRKTVVGAVAGSEKGNGYINIRFSGNQVLAHRLAWAFVHGDFPSFVDHINGNRTDNRICNLRSVAKSQNSMNAIKPRHGRTSKYKGVSFDQARNKWRAQICIHGERTAIGRFEAEEQAAAAYDWRAVQIFGKYAKPNGDVFFL